MSVRSQKPSALMVAERIGRFRVGGMPGASSVGGGHKERALAHGYSRSTPAGFERWHTQLCKVNSYKVQTAQAGEPGPRRADGRIVLANYCGIPGNCIFCGSPLTWELSSVRIFFSSMVMSPLVNFTMA